MCWARMAHNELVDPRLAAQHRVQRRRVKPHSKVDHMPKVAGSKNEAQLHRAHEVECGLVPRFNFALRGHLNAPEKLHTKKSVSSRTYLRGGSFCRVGLFAGRDLSLRGGKSRAAQNKLIPSNQLFSGQNCQKRSICGAEVNICGAGIKVHPDRHSCLSSVPHPAPTAASFSPPFRPTPRAATGPRVSPFNLVIKAELLVELLTPRLFDSMEVELERHPILILQFAPLLIPRP
ncbi:hypothetical protein B0H13DRAFT_1873341 [Mycena leptocephala]|nr:hypothetical protein B0H13DRAFT_1873341 [Mycena leptocephala]